MKQKLVQLAKEKGFVSIFVYDKPFLHSSKEPLRWLFWMSELQKWFREVHKINVVIMPWNPTDWWWQVEDLTKYLESHCLMAESKNELYSSYESALEVGLFEILKLIKVNGTTGESN